MVWCDGFIDWFSRDEPEHLRRGRIGERAARRYLRKAGLKFLYANFKGERGEIDLIFRDKEILVFVEVKARSSEAWRRPAAAVTPDKQRRITATARDYLRLLGRSDIPVRYDIVEVLLKEGRVNEIRHQPNAFAPARKSH